MAGIEVRGIDKLKRDIAAFSGELPYANALAQNRTARIIWEGEKEQMRSDIDKPTPWSLGALIYEKTTKSTKPKARVWFKDPFGFKSGLGAEDYLGVQILGGVRTRERRSEKRLRLAGLMRPGYTWVPAKGVKLNKYGNVSGPLLTKILSDLGTIDAARRTKTLGTAKYVVGTLGPKKVPAIFQVMRGGKDLKPILWLIPAPRYKKRYRFYERAEREIDANLSKELNKAIGQALRTMK